MLIASFIVLALSTAIYRFIGRKHTDLFRLFTYLWMLTIFLGIWNPYGYYEISRHFSTILFIGIISWILGYAFFYALKKNKNDSAAKSKYIREYKLKNHNVIIPVLLLYEAVLGFFLILIIFKSIEHLRAGYSFGSLHTYLYGTDEDDHLFTNPIIFALYNKCMFPVTWVMIPVCIMLLFEKKEKGIALTSLVIILIYSLLSGRRVFILYMAIDVVLLTPVFSVNIYKEHKKLVLSIVLILIVFISLSTVLRLNISETGAWEEIYNQFFSYVGLSLPLGDFWIDQIDQSGIIGYGYASFRGIIGILNSVFRLLSIPEFLRPDVSEMIGHTQTWFADIGNGHLGNAFVTWVFSFYLDGRIFGVVLGSFLFGGITGLIQKLIYSKKDYLYVALYLVFSQAVFKSLVRWEFVISSYPLSFMYLKLLYGAEYDDQ